MIPLTPFKAHCNRWASGCGHGQCSTSGTRVCLFRGRIPCDLLFVGEAPGESENVLGAPFVGQAGILLDTIIEKGVYRDYPNVRVGISNLVGCIPRADDGVKAGEPDDDQIWQCSDRLIDLVRIASPKLLVCVGRLSRQWLSPGMKDSIEVPLEIPRLNIIHPAAILRLPTNIRSLKVQEAIVDLNNAIEELGLA